MRENERDNSKQSKEEKRQKRLPTHADEKKEEERTVVSKEENKKKPTSEPLPSRQRFTTKHPLLTGSPITTPSGRTFLSPIKSVEFAGRISVIHVLKRLLVLAYNELENTIDTETGMPVMAFATGGSIEVKRDDLMGQDEEGTQQVAVWKLPEGFNNDIDEERHTLGSLAAEWEREMNLKQLWGIIEVSRIIKWRLRYTLLLWSLMSF